MSLFTLEDNPFRNYIQASADAGDRRRRLRWVWVAAQLAGVAAFGALIAGMVTRPEATRTLLWGLLVPSLPALFMVAPGIWRNVCPMAFVNQIPRRLGFSRELSLSRRGRENAFLAAIVVFFAVVASRHLLFNHDSDALLALLVLAAVLPFVGGLVFKGKSGWCGTFCPLAPIQKAYGQAALQRVDNAYCDPCLGCQKNCYDFNPYAALHADLSDDSEWFTGHRKLFFGALPGFVLAYFTAETALAEGVTAYLLYLLSVVGLSLGLFHAVLYLLPIGVIRGVQVFTVAAFCIFYWHAIPVMAATVGLLTHTTPPLDLVQGLKALPVVLGLAMLVKGRLLRVAYQRFATESSVAQVSAGGLERLQARVQTKQAAVQVREKSSGRTLSAEAGTPLLDTLEAADLPINPGCRMGMCGADPVVILDGAENIEPMGDEERETLQRLGLGNRRLACMCRLNGPVTVSLDEADAEAAESTSSAGAEDAPDPGAPRYVVIGNGVAGVTLIDTLRQHGCTAHIDLVTREHHHFYNRMGIERLIYGRTGMDGLYLMSDEWYREHGVTTWLNTVAERIDREAGQVHLGTGETLPYDRLIIATGAAANLPPLPGSDLPGVFVVREASDAMALRAWHQTHGCANATVLGGGVLGLEMAESLRQLGLKVTIVNRSGWLMERQLDARAGSRLADYLSGLGMRVRLNAGVSEVRGEDRVRAVILDDRTGIDADLFVACVGVRPNTSLAAEAGLEVNRGIVVDEHMQTSDPAVYAIGDAAELPGTLSGLWPVSLEHGKAAAFHLLEEHYAPKLEQAVVRLKVPGIDVQSCGRIAPEGDDELIQAADEAAGRWRRLVVRDGYIEGAAFIDDPRTARVAMRAIAARERIEPDTLDRLRDGDWSALA